MAEVLLRTIAWSLALFGLVRLAWLETHVVVPVTRAQGWLGAAVFGRASAPVEVTLACSGADTLALCVGAILAYPTAWPLRLGGALLGTALVLALNTVRIGVLGRAAASPELFTALHLYVLPGLLMVGIAGYVFAWMRYADRVRPPTVSADAPGPRSVPTWRLAGVTGVLLVLFVAGAPLYLESAFVLSVAAFVARAAATVLGLLGVSAVATGNVLATDRGAFLVTQECLVTPLVPLYVAVALTCLRSWRRPLALLLAGPVFVALGVVRLLVVALPAAIIGSPLFLIHAFYQLLLGALLVLAAACWRYGPGAVAARRGLLGAVVGGALVCLLTPLGTRALAAAGADLLDQQGAIALLPGFQIGLFVALCVATFAVFRPRPMVTGFLAIAGAQVVLFAVLYLLRDAAIAAPHVRDVRAWAIAGPLLCIAAMVRHERTTA